MTDPILIERQGAVAKITLHRPTAGNAIDVPMARALLQTAIACDQDPGVRCVLLTGAGRLFCAGGDVSIFASQGERLPTYIKEITTYLHGALARFARMDKPMVTAINGAAAGAGIGLAVIGDIALAAPEAHFTLAYTGIGMSLDGGATWLLPRLIGMRRAQELIITNPRLKADEAVSIGSITRVAASGQLDAEASALAEKLAAGATSAFGASRRLLLDSMSAAFETQLDAESRGIVGLARSPDGREGMAAFLEKRAPVFTGVR